MSSNSRYQQYSISHRKRRRKPCRSKAAGTVFFLVGPLFLFGFLWTRIAHFAITNSSKNYAASSNNTKNNNLPVDQLVPLSSRKRLGSPGDSGVLDTVVVSSNASIDAVTGLPAWFQNYQAWHSQQRRLLQQSPDDVLSHQKFLILRCFQTDRACGGLSDRLKPLPLLLLLAAQTNRIFLISWTRPCALEEFLVPPSTSTNHFALDWRVPDPLQSKMTSRHLQYYKTADEIFQGIRTEHSLVSVKLQDQHGGSSYYNMDFKQGPRAYRKVFKPIFQALFQPSPSLSAALQAEQQSSLVLQQPGSYAGAHLRAYYTPTPWSVEQVRATAINAVQCASQLRPGVPIYFTSDSQQAVDAIREYSQRYHRNIVTMNNNYRSHEALHLDKAVSTDPSDYFDVFLDIYHYSNAACISHGLGGFGRLGVLLSRNASCLMPFITQGRLVECQWRD